MHAEILCPTKAIWQWADNVTPTEWNSYEQDVEKFIESSYEAGEVEVSLDKKFPHLPYVIDFDESVQISKKTGFARPIRRLGGSETDQLRREKSEEKRKRTQSTTTNKTVADGISIVGNPSAAIKRKKGSRNSSEKTQRVQEKTASKESHDQMLGVIAGPSGKTAEKHVLNESPKAMAVRAKKKGNEAKAEMEDNNSSSSSSSNSSNSRTLLKKLASPALAIADLILKKGRTKKSRRGKKTSTAATAICMPFPPYECRTRAKSVKGVKKPADICIIQNQSGSLTADEMLCKYSSTVKEFPFDEDCCICCESLRAPSTYEENNEGEHGIVIRLNLCSHSFHSACITAMYNSGNREGFLQCPTCKIIYGVKIGNQPEGTMDYQVLPCSLPGHPDCDTISITYSIIPGVQGSEHPEPGKPFTARGFPRRGYLPDNDEGRKVLRLLIKAWERRLVFTIGTSSTTGEDFTVTWNEIHHKTEFGSNYSGHGFPDPHYLNNVLQELALQGVVDEDNDQNS